MEEKHSTVVTDAIPYMTTRTKGLELLYPKMVHVICLADGLHRVAEELKPCDIDRPFLIGR